MNKICLVGRLTKDPELNFLPGNGTAVVKFTLAVNRPHLDKTKPQEADFINCTCFGKRAESIANYVAKSHRFGIEGSLRINKYVDKDGNNRWSTEVLVSDFEFMQDKGTNSSAPSNNVQTASHDEVIPIDDGDIPF
ncbi:single-stranded DNA-binding protein (plasmid) [Clostridium botulinum A2B3 87]|uniref:single-stranded DNA-binding protein n=1 Tax=Clostridium botulinum TaxID=1491 RepID=UPI0004A57EF6|nr:single-stranded DNA-binding protein [Clostridium botulinum]KRU29335.1 single-stranded DNA-binding protein [Clostridium sporogenes]KEI94450.1 single-stranded DNA-binding protein [Clostridium botulinum A2B3 87]KRU33423.1 single-stranded DNA-binding protein [Clostridium sporogenes]KRU33945.1 single-stranded DNA-binding protein [Clostridium sporogenes]KRU43407.1 single-stranded DNA-binding protein [Clostridium sporogenes]